MPLAVPQMRRCRLSPHTLHKHAICSTTSPWEGGGRRVIDKSSNMTLCPTGFWTDALKLLQNCSTINPLRYFGAISVHRPTKPNRHRPISAKLGTLRILVNIGPSFPQVGRKLNLSMLFRPNAESERVLNTPLLLPTPAMRMPLHVHVRKNNNVHASMIKRVGCILHHCARIRARADRQRVQTLGIPTTKATARCVGGA